MQITLNLDESLLNEAFQLTNLTTQEELTPHNGYLIKQKLSIVCQRADEIQVKWQMFL